MASTNEHLRKTFLTGIFAAVPLGVTVFIIWVVDERTKFISQWLFGRSIPFLGILIAIAAIYGIGLLANSLLGKLFLHVIDAILVRLPVIKPVYTAWKQIALTPGGTEGTFSKVVLIPDESGQMRILGFSSGRLVQRNPDTMCVFVPFAPNPITGRLYFVTADRCIFPDITPEEAFKVILSTGNYVPSLLPHEATSQTKNANPFERAVSSTR